MNRLISATLCSVAVGTIGLTAPARSEASGAIESDGHGNGHRKDNREMAVEVWFPPQDVLVIREYYAPRYQNLPPGQRKKLQRSGHLPPGWEKKFKPLPTDVERQLVVLPREYRRGIIDGHAVIFNRHTQTIVDLAVLF